MRSSSERFSARAASAALEASTRPQSRASASIRNQVSTAPTAMKPETVATTTGSSGSLNNTPRPT